MLINMSENMTGFLQKHTQNILRKHRETSGDIKAVIAKHIQTHTKTHLFVGGSFYRRLTQRVSPEAAEELVLFGSDLWQNVGGTF